MKLAGQQQSERLCTGRIFQNKKQVALLTCQYASSASKWLRLGPLKFQMNSVQIGHGTILELMSLKECGIMKSLTLKDELQTWGSRKEKPIGMKDKSWPEIRQTKFSFVAEKGNTVYEKVYRRLEHLTNFKLNSTKGQAKNVYVANYGMGGSTDLHIDDMTGVMIATVVMILEAPRAGGATVWPFAGISVFPRTGSAILWYNLSRDGELDPFTFHKGCSVILGNKWIGNKWIIANGQWNDPKYKCALSTSTFFTSESLIN